MFGPISSAYYNRIYHGDLQEDSVQLDLARRLDILYEHLHHPFRSFFMLKHKGLYIVGNVGRGKTYLMDLFYESVNVPKQRMHYHIFITYIHARLNVYPDHAWDYLAKEVYQHGYVICLDEFQLHDMGDVTILWQFFKKFFKLGGVLVTTSNYLPKEFDIIDKERLNLFSEFLFQHVDIFLLNQGPDYRLKGKETCRRLHINSHNSVANQDLKESYPGCVYTFYELFECPMGVSEYDAILNKCNCIVIKDLRQLTDNDSNSLLRLIKFVDLLYEHKNSLLLYSSVDLKDIYIGNKYQRMFQRTLSRLFELTSQ